MAEHYSELEVAHTERVQSSPEVVDYSSFAPQRASLSHDSPEVVSQPTFTSNAAHNSLLSDGDETDAKKWHPPVRMLARTMATGNSQYHRHLLHPITQPSTVLVSRRTTAISRRSRNQVRRRKHITKMVRQENKRPNPNVGVSYSGSSLGFSLWSLWS